MTPRRDPARAALDAVDRTIENADERGPDDLTLDALEEAAKILRGAPEGRVYGVCVGGAIVADGDDEIRDPLRALARAEELAADPDLGGEPIQVLLWGASAA